MAEEKTPMWLRILEIILGLLAMVLAFVIIALPAIASLLGIILVFAIGLLFLGLTSLFRGIFYKDLPGWSRALNIIAGFIAIILAPITLLEPLYGAFMILWLMAFGMMFYGLTNLMLGFAAGGVPGWYRALLVIFGFILLILSFQVIWYPLWGLLFTIFAFSFGLIFGGISLLIAGATGQQLRAGA
jgi:uncharacterized membrane protein HdeD (DUF308 family)